MNATRFSISCASLTLVLGLTVWAQQDPTTPAKKKDKKQSANAPSETLAKPMSEKERKKKEAAQRKELETPYKKWLNEDVTYIITDEERAAFKRLQTDDEREQFIEQFWLRRDPSPDTEENEFKEEHYRRIAYANERFASGIPGWKTDRGRIYITFGPPDEIEDHSSGGFYERPPEEGGGETSTFPFQQWRYRYIEGVGTNIIIEFVDPTMSGEFHMTMDPSEKDALTYVPNAGLTLMEQMGLSDKTQRFNNTDGTHLGQAFGGQTEAMNEFTRLEQFSNLQRPPHIKFDDLESQVSHRINYNELPMKVRTDYFPVTDATVLTNVTIQFDNKDLQFTSKEGVQRAQVQIVGHITTLTRRRTADFDQLVTVDSPKEMLQQFAAQKSLYQKTIPLVPGTYRLNVIVKDIVAGTLNNYEQSLTVPRLDADKMTSSSLVLADLMEEVPPKSIGTGQFVIGDTKVRPRIGDVFRRDERMYIFMKVYNCATDEITHKPVGQVTFEVMKNGSTDVLAQQTEDISQIPNASSSQVTIEKFLNLQQFAPGQYTIRMKITDKNRNQVLTPTAQFTVT